MACTRCGERGNVKRGATPSFDAFVLSQSFDVDLIKGWTSGDGSVDDTGYCKALALRKNHNGYWRKNI